MPLKKCECLPWPFNYAKNWYGVELYESDLIYINNVVTSDKMYRLILQAHNINTSFVCVTNPEKYDDQHIISFTEGRWRDVVEIGNDICFFTKFLDDPNCPLRLKFFFFQWIGQYLGYIRYNKLYNDYLQRSFLAQRWMEICR